MPPTRTSLHGPRAERRRDTQFVAGMGAEGIVRHQLVGDAARQLRFEASSLVNARELFALEFYIVLQLVSLLRQIRLFGIGL